MWRPHWTQQGWNWISFSWYLMIKWPASTLWMVVYDIGYATTWLCNQALKKRGSISRDSDPKKVKLSEYILKFFTIFFCSVQYYQNIFLRKCQWFMTNKYDYFLSDKTLWWSWKRSLLRRRFTDNDVRIGFNHSGHIFWRELLLFF